MNIRPPPPIPDQTIAERLDEIEKALKFDTDREYRRELIREYLRLSEPKPQELDL